MTDVFISPREIAARLGISETAAYRYLQAGVIPAQRTGRRILVHRADFDRWCREGNRDGTRGHPSDGTREGGEVETILRRLLSGEIELVIRARRTAT